MQTVYVDVLLVFNLYTDYILLRLTARLTHSRLTAMRALAGAGIGAVSSLMLFLPPLHPLLSLLCRIVFAAAMCLAAFGFQSPGRFAWRILCFFLTALCMAGVMFALTLTGRVRFLQGNSCFYLDVSPLHLVLFTIASYCLLTVAQRVYQRLHTAKGTYRVQIRYRRHSVQLEGLADTGNSLTDFLTGRPVIICGRKALADMLPEDLEKPLRGFRLLPCKTVSGSGLIPVFRPDEVVIYEEGSGIYRKVDVLVGAAQEGDPVAVFHPGVL